MPAPDPTGNMLAVLPIWVQVAANFGMFLVAVCAAAYGFWHKLTASGLIADHHFEEGGAFHKTADDIRELSDAMKRLANAAEALLKIKQDQAREEDIEREVARRLKDHSASSR